MSKKVDRNKKNARTKADNLALPYEAVKAYGSAGEDTDPLGSWTGTARTGEAGPAPEDGPQTAAPQAIDTDNGHKPGDVGMSGILLPPRERAPRGGDLLPGSNGLHGGPFPVGEPVQQGVPGGKTYLNVRSPDDSSPTQDADDL